MKKAVRTRSICASLPLSQSPLYPEPSGGVFHWQIMEYVEWRRKYLPNSFLRISCRCLGRTLVSAESARSQRRADCGESQQAADAQQHEVPVRVFAEGLPRRLDAPVYGVESGDRAYPIGHDILGHQDRGK